MNPKINLIQIDIRDKASLLKACDLLHDAKFDMDLSKWDNESGVWSACFEREFFEDKRLCSLDKDWIVLKKYSFPLCDTFLELRNVKTLTCIDKSRIGIYTFNECVPNDGGYDFYFCEDMTISLRFAGSPSGIFRDRKLLDTRGAFWSFRDWATRWGG